MVVILPDETQKPAASLLRTSGAGESQVVLPAAQRAGPHVLRRSTPRGVPVRTPRAVNVAAEECDISVVPPERLAGDEVMARAALAPPSMSMREAVRSARSRGELSILGIIILAGLLALELALMKLFAPRQVDSEAMLQRAMQL
jgi:hypothetical protein